LYTKVLGTLWIIENLLNRDRRKVSDVNGAKQSKMINSQKVALKIPLATYQLTQTKVVAVFHIKIDRLSNHFCLKLKKIINFNYSDAVFISYSGNVDTKHQ